MRKEGNNETLVLIVDDFHPNLMLGLSKLKIKFDYKPEIERHQILEILENYNGIIIRSKVVCDKEFFEKAKQLKWITKGGSGIDSIDEDEAKKRNITIINAPEGNRNAVAEHTVGMILNLANNLANSFNDIKNFQWNREANRGIELEGKVLGIIGFGNIGSTLAKKISSFDMKVLAYDKYNKVNSPYAIDSDLHRIFEEADWLSLHIPLTAETKGMVNFEFLKKFHKPIGLINNSRGKVVNTKDVLDALKLGQIMAFGADVLENEKPNQWNPNEKKIYSSLMSMQNVILTPHVAGWTRESYQKISDIIIKKVEQLLSKKDTLK